MEFYDDGTLVYTIHEVGKLRRMILTYEINGNQLITDQPSHPQKQVTKFELVNGELILYFMGIRSAYIKVET